MAAFIALGLVVGLGWPSAGEIAGARDHVYAGDTLQKTLPTAANQPTTPQQDGPVDADRKPRRRRPAAERSTSSKGGSGLGMGLLWFIIGGLVLGAATVLTREWFSGRRPAAFIPDQSVVVVPAVRLDRGMLTDLERLAAQGRFAEAVHAMLLRTFESIGAQRALPSALTSREVLARAGLSDGAHGALRELVLAVECTLFGGQEATAEDYRRCVASYERVLSADGVEAS